MDKEKVMSWLEGLAEPDWRECYSDSEVQETARQALDLIDELLKEQEAIEPIPYHRSDGTIFKYECRKCRTKIFKMDSFCRRCGQALRWK